MLTHKGTQSIETERLILRRVRTDDAQSMFNNYANDPEVTKYLSWPTHTDVGITAMVIEDWINSYRRDDFYLWAIIVKEDGDELIGTISVVKCDDDKRNAEIGYCIGKKWWHRGIMTEALQAVMEYLFDQVGFDRVEAGHDVRNPNSGKVMMKCGMKYQHTFYQSGQNNQGVCDISVYALRSDER